MEKIITKVLIATVIVFQINKADAQVDLQKGLVAIYPFSGNAMDGSGNGINGTVTGATLTADRFGNANSAYNFKATKSQYITLGNPAQFQFLSGDTFSISAWFKTDTTSTQAILSHGQGGYAFYVQNLTNDYAKFSQATVAHTSYNSNDNNPILPVGQWNNVVVVNNVGTSVSIYVNGTLVNQYSTSFPYTYTYSDKLDIGRSLEITSQYLFDGAIDDIRIYKRGLSTQEISAIYNLTSSGVTAIISEEISDEGNVIAYPNPTTNTISVNSTGKAVVSVEIIDARGLVVLSSNYTSPINISSWQNGIYFLRAKDVDGSILQTFKVLKE